MLTTVLRCHFKVFVLCGVFSAFLMGLFLVQGASATELPYIMTKPEFRPDAHGWEEYTGYFNRESNGIDRTCDGKIICAGIPGGAYPIDRDAASAGGKAVVVLDWPSPNRFSEEMADYLNGADVQSSYGAAFVILNMLDRRPGSDEDPREKAREYLSEWQERVNWYFNERLVARLQFDDTDTYFNTYYQKNNDVGWYQHTTAESRTSTLLLFLNPAKRTDYREALYAIRLECANPLGHGLLAPPTKQQSVDVKTEIKIGTGQWSNIDGIEVPPGTTVQWRHTITNPETAAVSGTYQVRDNKLGATYTTTGTTDTLNPAPFSYGSNNWSTTKEFKDRGQGTISVITTGTYTIPEATADGSMFCESAQATTQSVAVSRQLCVKIKQRAVVSACSLPNSTYSEDKGGTQAQSGVVNYSQDTGWKVTDGATSTPAMVWARPGDSVQFKHTLCFGAQAVKGDKKDYGTDVDKKADKTTKVNTATISARTEPNYGGNYLFEKTLSGDNVQSFALTKNTPRPPEVSGADEVGDYYFTYYSPSNNSGYMYDCVSMRYDGRSMIPLPNAYQIPDFGGRSDCRSAQKTSNSDAGKVIEQHLTWEKVQAHISTYSSGGSAPCGCNNRDNFTKASLKYPSFDEAPITDEGYSVGHHKWGCVTDGSCGTCSCPSTPSTPPCVLDCSTKYSGDDYWYYPLAESSVPGATQIAQVKVPYNYKTEVKVGGAGDPEVISGGDMTTNIEVDIIRRPNEEIPGMDYATITKPTKYEVVAYTVGPETGTDKMMPGTDQGDPGTCVYYRSRGGTSDCELVDSGEEIFNTDGDLGGDLDGYIPVNSLAVPDKPIGTKFCVAVGIWPSDSHDAPRGLASGAGENNTALDHDAGRYWNYSRPYCRTIAKRPMVQFWSAGVYTTGGITTSQTQKVVNYSLASGQFNSNVAGDGKRNVYGSFSEYEVIAKKRINGFASGAGFGYERNNGGALWNSAIIPGTGVGAALPGGYPGVLQTAVPDKCTYSTQTFNNDRCGDGALGNSSVASFGSTIVDRLLTRYTSDDSSVPTATSSDLNLSNVTYKMPSGARYVKYDGDATIVAEYNMPSGSENNTLVIDVAGTLKIDKNITYGAITDGSNTSGTNTTVYSNISQLPQILIFADDILIKGDVKQVDAWLIAGRRSDDSSGIINTCYDFAGQIGQGSNVPSGTAYLQCSNTLRVNGPVFARKLVLNRNAGAENGNASINPAEVFSLRADAYLWAYDQATRNSQAVTTYQRELAPRY